MATYYTKEQLKELRQIGLADYLRASEPHELVDKGHGRYSTQEHDSVIIFQDGWYRFSTDQQGKSALDYLTDVRGYDFMTAADAVAGVAVLPAGTDPPKQKKEDSSHEQNPDAPRRVSLPMRNPDGYQAAVDYLVDRGIDKGLVWQLIKSRDIYQGIYYDKDAGTEHRCVVFTGKDKEGIVRLATTRFIDGDRKPIMVGSNRKYGFFLPAKDTNADTEPCPLFVYESPIDLLSNITLRKIRDGMPIRSQLAGEHHLSLSGLSMLAIEQTIKDYNVGSIQCCLDNDDKGCKMTQQIKETYQDRMEVRDLADYAPGEDVNIQLQQYISEIRADGLWYTVTPEPPKPKEIFRPTPKPIKLEYMDDFTDAEKELIQEEVDFMREEVDVPLTEDYMASVELKVSGRRKEREWRVYKEKIEDEDEDIDAYGELDPSTKAKLSEMGLRIDEVVDMFFSEKNGDVDSYAAEPVSYTPAPDEGVMPDPKNLTHDNEIER
jgi:hypothetical protein